MEPIQCVVISIVVYTGGSKPTDGHREGRILAHRYDIPRAVWERRKWVINWRSARVQCQYPKCHVSTEFCFYDKKTGASMDTYNKWVSAKGQVTKIERRMAEFERNYLPTLFLPKAQSTESWKIAEAKLNTYKNLVEVYKHQLDEETNHNIGGL